MSASDSSIFDQLLRDSPRDSISNVFAVIFRVLVEQCDKSHLIVDEISDRPDDLICFLDAIRLYGVNSRVITSIYCETESKQVCEYILKNTRDSLDLDEVYDRIDGTNLDEFDSWKLTAVGLSHTQYPKCRRIDKDSKQQCAVEISYGIFCQEHSPRCTHHTKGERCTFKAYGSDDGDDVVCAMHERQPIPMPKR